MHFYEGLLASALKKRPQNETKPRKTVNWKRQFEIDFESQKDGVSMTMAIAFEISIPGFELSGSWLVLGRREGSYTKWNEKRKATGPFSKQGGKSEEKNTSKGKKSDY